MNTNDKSNRFHTVLTFLSNYPAFFTSMADDGVVFEMVLLALDAVDKH